MGSITVTENPREEAHPHCDTSFLVGRTIYLLCRESGPRETLVRTRRTTAREEPHQDSHFWAQGNLLNEVTTDLSLAEAFDPPVLGPILGHVLNLRTSRDNP